MKKANSATTAVALGITAAAAAVTGHAQGFHVPSFNSPFTTSHLRGQIGASIQRDQQGNVQNIQFSYERTLLVYDKNSNTATVFKAPKTIGEICDTNPPKMFPLMDNGRMAEVTVLSQTPGAAEINQLCGPKRSIIEGALKQSPVEAGPPGTH